jgi:hypothetical protein
MIHVGIHIIETDALLFNFGPSNLCTRFHSRWGHWIFQLILLSAVSMVLTLSVTLSTRNLPADKARPELKVELFVQIMWEPQRNTTIQSPWLIKGIVLSFHTCLISIDYCKAYSCKHKTLPRFQPASPLLAVCPPMAGCGNAASQSLRYCVLLWSSPNKSLTRHIHTVRLLSRRTSAVRHYALGTAGSFANLFRWNDKRAQHIGPMHI